jgi:glycosyltransferase involved in cell wall biosynthesis
VMSFNRPHYLEPVLESLAAQTSLNGRAVVLFQDNSVSPHSGNRYAQDRDIAACIETFSRIFPAGEVILAEHNLGIARNFLRAEEFMFDKENNEACYFFEDDLVLSPYYLAMMDQIYSFAKANDRVGYFGAYGMLRMPLEQQTQHCGVMRRLSFHWGFGLTRQHWSDLRSWLEPYYKFTEGMDYKDKRRNEAAQEYRQRGVPVTTANQDVMKQIGTTQLGRVSINTTACFANYIGVQGVNCTPEKYERQGFGRNFMYPEPVELKFPTDRQLINWHEQQKRLQWVRFNERVGKRRNGRLVLSEEEE